MAARFLERRGCRVLARNVRVGRGELDLLVRDENLIVAVEVKTGVGAIDHFTEEKRASVLTAMRGLSPRPRRLDLVTVVPDHSGVVISWCRGV